MNRLVAEYCCAGSLYDLMEICERTLNEEQIAVAMKYALMGLKYLQDHDIIHRDIKAADLLLTHQGECKIGAFECIARRSLFVLCCRRSWLLRRRETATA